MMDKAILERAKHDVRNDGDAKRLAREVVARFVRNPVAFAEATNAANPSAFVQTYLSGVDKRLSEVIGLPKDAPVRIATMGMMTTGTPTDWRDPSHALREDVVTMPHMGVVAVVATVAAVVSASAAVVSAAAAVGLLSRKPIPL